MVNGLKKKIIAGGLGAALALSGCSSPRKAIGNSGAALRVAGKATGVVEAQKIGGLLGVAAHLLFFDEMGEMNVKEGERKPPRPSYAFVENKTDLGYTEEGILENPRMMRTPGNFQRNFERGDDLVVAVDTRKWGGWTLEIEIQRKKPYSEWSGFERFNYSSPYKRIASKKYEVKQGENNFIWDPFEDSYENYGYYLMICKARKDGEKELVGADIWSHNHLIGGDKPPIMGSSPTKDE